MCCWMIFYVLCLACVCIRDAHYGLDFRRLLFRSGRFGAEFAAQAVAMLPGAFDEIAGYAQVKLAVAAAGHDVDVTGLAHRISLPCSCEGRNPALPSTCNRTV